MLALVFPEVVLPVFDTWRQCTPRLCALILCRFPRLSGLAPQVQGFAAHVQSTAQNLERELTPHFTYPLVFIGGAPLPFLDAVRLTGRLRDRQTHTEMLRDDPGQHTEAREPAPGLCVWRSDAPAEPQQALRAREGRSRASVGAMVCQEHEPVAAPEILGSLAWRQAWHGVRAQLEELARRLRHSQYAALLLHSK